MLQKNALKEGLFIKSVKGGFLMYLALYRKYRPRTFDDVISQEHITTTLKNQIINGTAGHAYLFTGSRGTGKTTCAKILAMAVNCKHPVNGNPCLECETCKEILSDAATDIVEMDAASNNSVDDVRQLRDEVAYTPVSCKYKVYIIDEVHMLSASAFNALLKTLEEPPEHVKFILATTELHKVPATIVSRCQRFSFRRVDDRDSAKRLLWVAEKESVTLEENAAELISKLSDGGMRDALSILDRCVAANEHITVDVVRDCAGVADTGHLFKFSEMVAAKDTAGCLKLLGELHAASKDIARIIDELSGHYRDLMLYKAVPNEKELLSVMPDEYSEIERIAGLYTLGDILRCLSLLQKCADSIGRTRQRKTAAEMCLIKMCLGLSEEAPAVQKAAVIPTSAGIAVEVKAVPEKRPKEDFTPTPLEDMSPKNAATISKLRQLSEETTKIAKENIESKTQSYAPPDYGDVPPPEPPPLPSAPPEPYPMEEYSASTNTITPKKSSKARSAASKKEKPKKSESEPAIKSNDSVAALTPEEWKAAAEKTSPMNRPMLKGAEAALEGNTLVIRSSHNMLLQAAKRGSLGELEKELSEALGKAITIRVEDAGTEKELQDSAVNRLLDRAKQLDIEVIYK